MKISFIEWFVNLLIKDMKDYTYNNDEKEKIYTKIRNTVNIKKKCEKKI